MDISSLQRELTDVVGDANVFVKGEAAKYRRIITIVNPDKALLVSEVPDVVVRPASTEEVSAVVRIANASKTPVYVQAGGTDVTGGSTPLKKGILIDMIRMDKILKISRDGMYTTVEASCDLAKLDSALEKKGLRLGHYPNSILLGVTVAGSVSTYGLGAEASGYDSIGDHVIGMEVVTPTGEILTIRPLYKSSMLEKNLMWLFIGMEGSHGVITKVTLGVQPFERKKRRTHIFEFPTFQDAIKCSYKLDSMRIRPAMMFSWNHVRAGWSIPKIAESGKKTGVLVVAFDEIVDEIADALEKELAKITKSMGGKDLGREVAENATQHMYKRLVKNDNLFTTVSWGSAATSFPDMARCIKWYAEGAKICKKYGLTMIASHWGPRNGCMAITPGYPGEATKEMQLNNVKCRYEILSLAVRMGGSADSANGNALKVSWFMTKELGETGVDLLEKVKHAIDPNDIFNPGKRWDFWPGQGEHTLAGDISP